VLLAGLVVWLVWTGVSGRSGGVELGQVSARGAIPARMARQVVAAALPRFEACWTRPGRGGHLVLHMRVPASPVRHRRLSPAVTVHQSSVFDRGLEACVVGVARALRFAPAQRDCHIWAQLNFLGADRRPSSPVAPPARRRALEVRGRVVNAANGQPLAGVTVLVLQPWVNLDGVDPDRLTRQVAGMAVTSPAGRFRVRVKMPRGFAYGVLVFARGFESVGSEAAVKPDRAGSSRARLGVIRLERRRY
jgi:hypothetical protein